MGDVLWGVWMRLRLASAKIQRYTFTIGKWLALAFIGIYVLGFMAGATLEMLGFPELSSPILDLISAVNETVRSILVG